MNKSWERKRSKEMNERIKEYWEEKGDTITEIYTGNLGVDLPKERVKGFFEAKLRYYLDNKTASGKSYSFKQALNKLWKSEFLTPERERYRSNAYEAIKNRKDKYKEFRHLTRDAKGRFTKIDISRFKYDDTLIEDGVTWSRYTYGNIEILLANSTKGTDVDPVRLRKM